MAIVVTNKYINRAGLNDAHIGEYVRPVSKGLVGVLGLLGAKDGGRDEQQKEASERS